MIEVTIKDDSLSIKGHADSAEYGHDLVCCAVSTAWYMILKTLDKANVLFAKKKETPGDCYLEFVGNANTYKVFNYMTDFFIDLEKQYPQYVRTNKKVQGVGYFL